MKALSSRRTFIVCFLSGLSAFQGINFFLHQVHHLLHHIDFLLLHGDAPDSSFAKRNSDAHRSAAQQSASDPCEDKTCFVMTRVQLAWLRLQNGTSASRVFVDPNYRKILRSTKMHNIIL